MSTESVAFGPFVLDRLREQLTRDGAPVPIGHRGYVLLETMLGANGGTVEKAALIERAWPGTIVEEGNLTVQIAALRKAIGDEFIVTVPRVGYRLVRPHVASATLATGAGRPLIAVLPFTNMSGEAEQSYFADGVVEDIITALSRFRTFAVVARNSSFVYRDRAVDVREVARELGVRYVLEGSVRRAGDRVRVTAQLIDAATGAHLWAEKFDGAAAEIFEFQDRITESVVGLIEPEIRKAEIDRSRRRPPDSLDAYDLFLRALPLVYSMKGSDYAPAITLLEQAAALDPGFAAATAYAAWCYEKRLTLDMPPLTADDREAGVLLARKALDIGRSDPVVSAICGWVTFAMSGDQSGLEAVRRAVEASPNNLVVLVLGGVANLIDNELGRARDCYHRAYRLGPGAPDAFWSLTGIGTIELLWGNSEAAVDWCRQSLSTFHDWPVTFWTLVPAYALLDRMDEARAALAQLLELTPEMTVSRLPFARGVTWEPMRAGLRKAGLPDGDTHLEYFGTSRPSSKDPK